MVPGHEITGYVSEVGTEAAAKGWKVGDRAGVGCMVDSCRSCNQCDKGLEQFCDTGMVGTYNGRQKYEGRADAVGTPTMGGYSNQIVVNSRFVVRVPEALDLKLAAPLLCAGITTYSPLKQYGLQAGQQLAVLGMGGLGHMGVKFGKAMGAHVTVISRSESKRADVEAWGCQFLNSGDAAAMKAAAKKFDMILDTVAADHPVNDYMGLLRFDGKLVLVGLPESPFPVHAFSLIAPRRTIAGSLIGGMPETQEMLNFCAEHNIMCDTELIKIDYVNEAYERTIKSDVKYRFVIDVEGSLPAPAL
jgi:uncharacterized zinc-type alcohol dehydrogenase-like protein